MMKNTKNTKKTKRTVKMFAAWDYEFEEQEFNRMSEQGWQLVSGGSFTQKYEYDDSVVYRYQLDYNNDVSDMTRYEETFRDAGWERVNSTLNGWHVFRKAYDPALPQEEYEIYTDDQSRNEMLKRWMRVCYIGFGMVLINFGNALRILDTSDAGFIGVGLMLACGMTFGMLIAGVLNINRMLGGQKNKRPYPMHAVSAAGGDHYRIRICPASGRLLSRPRSDVRTAYRSGNCRGRGGFEQKEIN